MGPLAMADAEEALQTGYTPSKPCGRLAASYLLAEEIQAHFCQHPFAQRTLISLLAPRGLLSLGWLLRAVHCLAQRQANGAAFFFYQRPSQQQRRQRGLGGGRGRTAQLVHLKQLFDAFEEQFDVPACLIQAQHVLVTPLFWRQGGDQQHPTCQLQRVRLHLLLFLVGNALLAPLGRLPLLLAQAQGPIHFK